MIFKKYWMQKFWKKVVYIFLIFHRVADNVVAIAHHCRVIPAHLVLIPLKINFKKWMNATKFWKTQFYIVVDDTVVPQLNRVIPAHLVLIALKN
jgi:hypothetical protein